MASVLAIGAYLIAQNIPEGQYVIWFVIGMLVIFGATDFCLSVTIMKKLGIKSCSSKEKSED